MESMIVLTLNDIGWFIIWALVSALLVYLILILHKAYKTIKDVQQIVSDNKEHIDKTIEVVPDLVSNVEEITEEVAHGSQAFRGTVDNVAQTTEDVTGALNENSSVIESIASVLETLAIGKSLCDKFFQDNNDEK